MHLTGELNGPPAALKPKRRWHRHAALLLCDRVPHELRSVGPAAKQFSVCVRRKGKVGLDSLHLGEPLGECWRLKSEQVQPCTTHGIRFQGKNTLVTHHKSLIAPLETGGNCDGLLLKEHVEGDAWKAFTLAPRLDCPIPVQVKCQRFRRRQVDAPGRDVSLCGQGQVGRAGFSLGAGVVHDHAFPRSKGGFGSVEAPFRSQDCRAASFCEFAGDKG